MDQIASCIHDELALFVQKYRRVVKDKTKVTRNCQNLHSSSTCVSQDKVFKEMNFLDSYGFREDKTLKGLVKCYLCGGAGHTDVECANNHMIESNGREESISAQWSDNDSDDSNNYITSSFKEANNFSLVGSVHNSSLARVHVVKEGKSDSRNESVSGDDRQDDQSYREQDDQSYLGMCVKYDVLFTETSTLKERNLLLEGKENNLVFQASNKNLLTQINEANDTVIKLTIGAKKVVKMLNMGKVHGDKIAFGYGCSSSCVPPPLTTFVKESNTKFDVLEPTRTQRFIPTCYHCGVKGHIRPRCNALRNVSRATNANDFKNHVSSLKTLNDLLYKVVKIPKVISLPHKVSKVKQVWIKKEDHVLSHFLKFYEEMGIKHEFSASTTPQQNVVVERKKKKIEFLLRWLGCFCGLLSPMLEGESPAHLSLLKTLYGSMIGSLLYLIASSPVISYSVGVCARFQSDPKESYIFCCQKRIIKYVSRTFEFGLWYTYDTCVNLVGYSDANWAGCSVGRKSTSGGVFYEGNNLVAWHSKK
ncbi:unnamed protein product [Prunus brigantina]